MAKQRYTTEEIIHKLREADVLIGQGQTVAQATKQIGVTDLPSFGHQPLDAVLRAAAAGRRDPAASVDHPPGCAVLLLRLSADHGPAVAGGLGCEPIAGRADLET
jgi:hypothetical protein